MHVDEDAEVTLGQRFPLIACYISYIAELGAIETL